MAPFGLTAHATQRSVSAASEAHHAGVQHSRHGCCGHRQLLIMVGRRMPVSERYAPPSTNGRTPRSGAGRSRGNKVSMLLPSALGGHPS